MSQEAKRAAGYRAAEFIESHMIVGIGTGSTAYFFIERLIERVKTEKLVIKGVATSKKSEQMAKEGGIPMIRPDHVAHIDINVDGADEIDPQKRMIKGGGGALLREKIIAEAAQKMIVIVDESKLVERLGTHPLPVEILPFGCQLTFNQIEEMGYRGVFRKEGNGALFVTDNGNYILDLTFDKLLNDPEDLHLQLSQLAGVIETGLFFTPISKVIVGFEGGDVEVRE